MDSKKIIDEANMYLNSDITIKELANLLSIDRKTLQIHLNDKLKEIDLELYNLVLNKKESQIKIGRIEGGKIGKRSPSYTKEDALDIAQDIIQLELTYEEANKKYGIPKSTIYEMVHSDFIPLEMKNKLDVVASANRRDLLVNDLKRMR